MGASMTVCIPDFEQNFLFFLQCSFFVYHTWVGTKTKKNRWWGEPAQQKKGQEDNDNLELIPT